VQFRCWRLRALFRRDISVKETEPADQSKLACKSKQIYRSSFPFEADKQSVIRQKKPSPTAQRSRRDIGRLQQRSREDLQQDFIWQPTNRICHVATKPGLSSHRYQRPTGGAFRSGRDSLCSTMAAENPAVFRAPEFKNYVVFFLGCFIILVSSAGLCGCFTHSASSYITLAAVACPLIFLVSLVQICCASAKVEPNSCVRHRLSTIFGVFLFVASGILTGFTGFALDNYCSFTLDTPEVT
jgi:hypothetical protein